MREQARTAQRCRWGVSGWLGLGEYAAAEQFFDESQALRADHLRLALTAAQWRSKQGRAWTRWLAKSATKSFGSQLRSIVRRPLPGRRQRQSARARPRPIAS